MELIQHKLGFRKFRRPTQIAYDDRSRNKRNYYNYRMEWELICILIIRITQCYGNFITCVWSVSASHSATYSFHEHISLTTIDRLLLIRYEIVKRQGRHVLSFILSPRVHSLRLITCEEKMNAFPGGNDQIDWCSSRFLNKLQLF